MRKHGGALWINYLGAPGMAERRGAWVRVVCFADVINNRLQ